MKLTENEIEEIKLLVKLKYMPFQLTYEYFLNLPVPVFVRLYREMISEDMPDSKFESELMRLRRAEAFKSIYGFFIGNNEFIADFEERIIRLCTEYYIENAINE